VKPLFQIVTPLSLIVALLGFVFYGVRGGELPLIAGLLCCTVILFTFRDRARRGNAGSALVVAMLSASVVQFR
jgi:hypothetical protein